MELTFLGTSCMVPTKERNVTGIFLSYDTYGLLFDCGEGTQRQMNIAGINRNKVTHIFISHWHGDHVSGLIGLIQTLGNQNAQNEDKKKLIIFGPKETERRIEHLLQTCIFDNKLLMEVHEINPKKGELIKILEREEFYISSAALDHGIPCLGYRFVEKDVRKIDMKKASSAGLASGPLIGKIQRGIDVEVNGKHITPDMVSTIKPGKKIGIILDTGLCQGTSLIAEDVDLLVCEASYSSAIEEKAENNKHMTAKQAALLASNSNVKKLILTHISQRYKTGTEVLEDAKDVFENVEVAYDFMKVKV
ncbi:MAG: ribonuclease Z [Candidatus Woesearchaeota archaeon]